MAATIFVDGTYAGQATPANLELVEGRHEVVLRLAGYEEWTKAMTLKAGGYEGLKASLKKEASAGRPRSRRPRPPTRSPPGPTASQPVLRRRRLGAGTH